jgi:hypothetical protein
LTASSSERFPDVLDGTSAHHRGTLSGQERAMEIESIEIRNYRVFRDARPPTLRQGVAGDELTNVH